VQVVGLMFLCGIKAISSYVPGLFGIAFFSEDFFFSRILIRG
jgi:hypothetical protein